MTGGVGGPLPALPRVWRPRRARAVVVPAVVLVVAGAAALAALLPGGWSAGDRAAVGCLGAACGLVLALFARPVVRADERGLTVVNLVRSRRLTWSEVVRVGLGRDDPWASLDLSDGSVLAVMALQASDGERARRGVAELAALASAYGEAGDAAGGAR